MLWEAALVEPVDPSHRGELDIVDGLERAVQERASLRYSLGLEQPNCALGQRIVLHIPDAADRCRNPLERKRFRERDRRVLTRFNRSTQHLKGWRVFRWDDHQNGRRR